MYTEKKNIVLDLDATLIFTFDDMSDIFKLVSPDSNGNVQDEDLNWLTIYSYVVHMNDPNEEGANSDYMMWGMYRPYLTEFATYLIENFENIYIWSAGKRKYVKAIVDNIFKELEYNPPIILDYDQTDIDSDTGVVHKPLQRLFDREECDATFENTYVIDDREDTFKYNRANGILVPPFVFSNDNQSRDDMLASTRKIMNEDRVLKDLICFFEDNKHVKDVRTLNLEEKFGASDAEDDAASFDRIVNKYRFSPSHNIKHQ